MTIKNWVAALTLFGCVMGATGCTNMDKNDKKAAEYYAQLGAGYLQQNRLALAKDYLEKALDKNKRSVNAQHYYALLQDRLGQHKKARLYFRKAVRQDRENPELLNNYGSHLCQNGETKLAVVAFMEALKDPLYKTPEFAWANAGACLQKKGETRQAALYLRKALDINERFPLALYKMAELEHSNGQNAAAQAFLYRYNELAADTPETLWLCYRVHRALQENSRAEKCANDLAAHFPKSKQARQLN